MYAYARSNIIYCNSRLYSAITAYNQALNYANSEIGNALSAIDFLANTKIKTFEELRTIINRLATIIYPEFLPKYFHNPLDFKVFNNFDEKILFNKSNEQAFNQAINQLISELLVLVDNSTCGTGRPMSTLHGIALIYALLAKLGGGTKKNNGLGIEGGKQAILEKINENTNQNVWNYFFEASTKIIQTTEIICNQLISETGRLIDCGNYYNKIAQVALEHRAQVFSLAEKLKNFIFSPFQPNYFGNLLNQYGQDASRYTLEVQLSIENIKKDINLLLTMINTPVLDQYGNLCSAPSPYNYSINYNLGQGYRPQPLLF